MQPNRLQFYITYISYLIIIGIGQGDYIKATSCHWHGGHPDELLLHLNAF